MHIISCVLIPTFITICLNKPSPFFSLYIGILFFIKKPNTTFAIFSDTGFCIIQFLIGIISCVLFAYTPITGSPDLSNPTGYCALFL